MKKLNSPICIILVAIAALCSTYCGKTSTTDIYLPDFNATWVNQANPLDKFFFLNAPPNQPTGTFSGNEFVNDVQVATFEGSFNHSKVTFVLTFLDNSPSKTYSGTMTGSSNRVLTLYSGNARLVLLQQF